MIRTALAAATLAVPLLLTGSASAGGADSTSFPFRGTVGAVVDRAPTADPRLLRHVGSQAPGGYSHDYQWAGPAADVRPENGPVTFTGTLDLRLAAPDDFAMLGLLDRAQLAVGENGWQDGAYVYIYVTANSEVILGLSDGNAGSGELVQTANTIPLSAFGKRRITFTVDGTRLGSGCGADASEQPTADGCLSLAVSDLPTLTDSYGSVTNGVTDTGVEFGGGAVPGYDGFGQVPTGITYNLTVSPARVSR